MNLFFIEALNNTKSRPAGAAEHPFRPRLIRLSFRHAFHFERSLALSLLDSHGFSVI